MVTPSAVLAKLIDGLRARPGVVVVTLFGSRARGVSAFPADADSDIDLQIVARRPESFVDRAWMEQIFGTDVVVAWTVRPAFGGAQKISAILRHGELDLVIVPYRRFRLARLAMAWGLHRRSPKIRRQLGDLAVVLATGHQVLIGAEGWSRFLARVVAEVPVPAMDDEEVRNLAEGALIDYCSIMRKLRRGELRAAQRWLHTGLAETNFRLWVEKQRRAGEPAFYDGRRLEQVAAPDDLSRLSVSSVIEAEALAAAATKAISTTRELGRVLIPAWQMPPAFSSPQTDRR